MGGLPCKWKILNNSETIESEAGILRRGVDREEVDVESEIGYKIITELNTAEDAVFRAKKLLGLSQGFEGPWPNSMKDNLYKQNKQIVGDE